MSSLIAHSQIRKRIATDMALLRELCHALVTVARFAGRDACRRDAIREVLEQVCAAVEQHFRYEEEVIAPLLREWDAWGPARVEQLLQTHAEQHAILVALAQDAREDACSIEELADEVVVFFRHFEQEIADRELHLLNAESLGAEPTVDQIDG